MKIKILIILFLTLLMIASCSKDPKELYSNYIENAQKISEYKIVYKFELPVQDSYIEIIDNQFGGIFDIKVGNFKKGDNQKTLMETKNNEQKFNYYIYNLPNNLISCTKGEYYYAESDEITCKKGADLYAQELTLFQNLTAITDKINSEKVSIEYLGSEDIIMRKCDSFIIDIDDISMFFEESDYFYYDENLDGKANLYVCIDKKTGLVLHSKLSKKTVSELDGEFTEDDIIELTATLINENVDDSEFELPVKFSELATECDDQNIITVIDPFVDYSGEITLNELDNYGKPIRSSKLSETLNKNIAVMLTFDFTDYKYSINELCIEDECQPITCGYEKTECIKNSNNQAACESNPDCIYTDPLCERFSCDKVTEESQCSSRNHCVWQLSGTPALPGYCYQESCYDFYTKDECEISDLNCEWGDTGYGPECAPFSCYTITTQEKCEANSPCEWYPDEWYQDELYKGYCENTF